MEAREALDGRARSLEVGIVELAERARRGVVRLAAVARVAGVEDERVGPDARCEREVAAHVARRVDEVQRAVAVEVDRARERAERLRVACAEVDEGHCPVVRERACAARRVVREGVGEQGRAFCAEEYLGGGEGCWVAGVVPVQMAETWLVRE